MIFKKRNNDHRGDSSENIGKSFHKEVDSSAEVSGDRAPDDADNEVDSRNNDGEHE